MRIDLFHGGRRPWPVRLILALVRVYVGVDSGPPTAFSYRPDLVGSEARRYLLRAARASSKWTKGQLEMFSAFVSKLNSCSF